MQTSPFFRRTLVILSSLALMTTNLLPSWSQDKGSIVVFEANWCASCREIVPIAREIASQNGLNLVEIDVDSPDAPKQARGLGVGIPNDEPPQVFYAHKGRMSLLYNGRGYKSGAVAKARTTILQNLQKSL